MELLSPVSIEEVKTAVFQLGALKAPCPDGFQGTFYQAYWEVVGSVIINATKDFMQCETILQDLNKTHIVLIPKVANPESISQFRPISLCNFPYEVFSKVLANRLKLVLSHLIS